ncbi:ribosome biogenesis GTP-binding protein YlqF [human gut metagenome]|uniref:Ribosome biogenesis GTP-binding protein YlqF n=1 Tax=human gut metagenome TaxID=408170 RepID=K1TWQ2_9ZZZZ
MDLIIELVDARVPLSSRNPDIDELGKNKARLILLNKADLAEDRRNDEWMEYFKKQGYSVVKVNSKKGGGIKSIQSVIQEACKEKMERDRKRGILNRPVRAMVVGIPNVGKSTFINALAGKACAKTGNKPGVTKGKQWIRLNKNPRLTSFFKLYFTAVTFPDASFVTEAVVFVPSAKLTLLPFFTAFTSLPFPCAVQEALDVTAFS